MTGVCSSVLPRVAGWEKNSKNKALAKMVNLSSSMDPVRWVWSGSKFIMHVHNNHRHFHVWLCPISHADWQNRQLT